ncbi:hypothetical protein EV179_001835 [Coemansia sp. RSA 487]|nr:hypothetical protein LPJ74_001656 [Coemansia sp. RSA 1843]KAJ2091858.1 hypothetical protein IW138_001547 [Coemansia sp. RSA 986]KAJ2215815.1 hypothetical protein EV179_001835 [Coemansia sp. RSA 487]
MLGATRIGRSAAQKAKLILVGPSVVPDRSQSKAFIKKGGSDAYKQRSGTVTSVNLDNANPEYYAGTPKPRVNSLNAHTANQSNINQFMQIEDGFLGSLGKGHFPGYLGADFKMFGGAALLYRKTTQDLVDQMAQHAQEGSRQAAVIDGKAGAGKSAELMKLAAVAASSGHLVIYAHATIPWVDSSRPYAPGSDGNTFVQHELTMELFQTVKDMSSDALAKIPLGKDISFGKRSLNAAQTLADLVDFALQIPSVSQDALDHLLAIASKQTIVPVLIAVDDVNTLWTNTFYRDQSDAILPASRLRLPSSFRPFFDGEMTLNRGWAVGAMSYIRNQFVSKELKTKLQPVTKIPVSNRMLKKDPALHSATPKPLPFEVIGIDRMSTSETWALMNFYHKVRVISSPVTDTLVAKRWITANGNPRDMFNSATSYF